ncbi:MAG TPA: glycine dehydrogenase (aminomethyl-transferring), partial [Burkholderiaceae bacterium]
MGSTPLEPRDPLVQPESAGEFAARHVGPTDGEIGAMLAAIGQPSLAAMVEAIVPASIRLPRQHRLALGEPTTEEDALARLAGIAARNQVFRSFIGTGYYGTRLPKVILRNLLENPAWYTAYTPYQAEISQGRLEALLAFQTLVSDLTALPVANASLLDEATAAAEAMALARRSSRSRSNVFFVSQDCHPQTVAVVRTRAEPLGIEVRVGDDAAAHGTDSFGLLLQDPASTGDACDHSALVQAAHARGALVAVATDLLALTL